MLLGAPGSGKTFLLMRIASYLLDAIHSNPTSALPLPLELADWRSTFSDFAAWVIELASKIYLVEKGTLREWMKNKRITLLLDGLDAIADPAEVPAANSSVRVARFGPRPPGLRALLRGPARPVAAHFHL